MNYSETAIVLCIGKNYWCHAAVVIASITQFTKYLNFFIIHDGEDAYWQQKITRNTKKNQCSVFFQNIEQKAVERFRIYGHPGRSTYYKLFIPELLDNRFKKFIYLDADLIFVKPIDPLLSINLQGHVLAARPFFVANELAGVNRVMGRPDNCIYFNTGVYVADNKLWISDSITEKAIETLVNYPEKISISEQCAINHAIGERGIQLPLEWNVTIQYWYPSTRQSVPGVTFENLVSARNDPAIVHYNGPTKPWHMADKHPYKHLYTRTRRKFYQPLYIADDFFPEVLKMVKTSPQNLANFCRRVLRKIKRLSGL